MSQKYSSTLRKSLWFNNIGAELFVRLPKGSEFRELQGYNPSLWKKVIFKFKSVFHSHEVETQQIFPSNDINARKVVDFLVKVHFKKSIRIYLSVCPPYIPIPICLTPLNDPSQIFSNLLNDGILSVADVNNNFFGSKFFWQLCNRDEFRRVICI
jgi:hypothetical protein